MKKSHILALGVIAIGIFMIISTLGNASTYLSFAEAKQFAQDGDTRSFHVVGELPRNARGEVIGLKYEPSVNPNRFEFLMIDSLQNQYMVVHNQPKPQDLEKSEKVVVVGKMNLSGGYFQAEKILLKCPSKYNNDELKIEEDGYAAN